MELLFVGWFFVHKSPELNQAHLLLISWSLRLHGNGFISQSVAIIWSQIKPDSKLSVDSQDKKTVEFGN